MIIRKENKLVMKDDIMFKAFFSKIGNEKYLKDFLSAIIGEDLEIKEVIHDARLEQLAREQKYGILDLEVKLKNGEIINIEMQMQNHNNMEKRTTFYASKKITEQLGNGVIYDNIKKFIVIAILDYTYLDVPEYVTKTVRVAEKHRDYQINNEVEYYYIELDKFRKENPDMKEKINQWLAFIDMERGDLLEMAKKENNLVKEANEKYNILTGEEEIKRLAEIRLMSEMEEQAALSTARERGKKQGMEEGKKQGMEEGKKQGMEEGKKQGMEEGKKQGIEEGKKQGIEEGERIQQIKIAKELLKTSMSINEIEKITKLSKSEIEQINNKD